MKHLLISLLALLSASTVAVAQTAREVLDRTAKQLEQSNGASANFTLTSFAGLTENGRTYGTIEMQGTKFHLTSSELETWFDGTTQWSMLSRSGEVNVQEPTEEELARMNPYAFISLYKKGYKYKIRKNIVVGAYNTYEVRLTAEDKSADLQTIIANIDMKTYNPLCIRLKHGDDWVRISIQNLNLSCTLDAATFTFPQEKYPNVVVIDLR